MSLTLLSVVSIGGQFQWAFIALWQPAFLQINVLLTFTISLIILLLLLLIPENDENCATNLIEMPPRGQIY